jgi:hypothetical protein
MKPDIVAAESYMVSSSAEIRIDTTKKSYDPRIKILEDFLKKKNSPLSDKSAKFIEEADKNNLDWRLVPAITGVESSFGIHIPVGSYNAYGWANGGKRFKSWDESIEVVSKALNEKYFQKGASNINKIARRYSPPSTTWAGNVKSFMDKIDSTPVEYDF